jgi:hypothetical protein
MSVLREAWYVMRETYNAKRNEAPRSLCVLRFTFYAPRFTLHGSLVFLYLAAGRCLLPAHTLHRHVEQCLRQGRC